MNGQERLAALAEGRPDPHQRLAGRVPGYPDGFLQAVDAAMNILPKERLQSAEEWLDLISKANLRVIDEYRGSAMGALGEPGDIAADALASAVQAAVEETRNVPNAELFSEAEDPPLAEETLAAWDDSEATPRRKGGVLSKGLAGLVVLGAIGAVAVEFGGESMGIDGGIAGLLQTEPASTVIALPDDGAVGQTPSVAALAPVPSTTPSKTTETDDTDLASIDPAAADEVEPAAGIETASLAQAETAPEPMAAGQTAALVEPQIAYAHWDVRLPFTAAPRRANNANIALIKDVSGDGSADTLPDWIAPGAAIFSVNGNALPRRGDLGAVILSDMGDAEEGTTQVRVAYKAAGSDRFENGDLVVPLIRSVGLASGAEVEIHKQGDAWKTVVVRTKGGELLPGDVILSETGTGLDLTDHAALEKVMETLVDEGNDTAEFQLDRNGVITTARVSLSDDQDG